MFIDALKAPHHRWVASTHAFCLGSPGFNSWPRGWPS